jgi:hypothetical protein
MDLGEIGVWCADVDWIKLAEDSVQWQACDHGDDPSGVIAAVQCS